MTNPVDFAITEFSQVDTSLYLTINGQQIPLVQLSMEFALNAIPQAYCLVGTGYDAYNVTQPAPIMSAIPNLLDILPATITFQPSGDYDPDGTPWPEEAQTIFSGYFNGVADAKTAQGKFTKSLAFAHWLSDLAFSSALSSETHPAGASDLAFQAGMVTAGAGALEQPANLARWVNYGNITADIQTDLWKGINDFLYSLANADPVFLSKCNVDGTLSNQAAQLALARMPGGSNSNNLTYPYYQPLTFNGSPLSGLLAKQAAQVLRGITARSLEQTTFWDVLIAQLAPTFGFSIVPLVDQALAAAVTPGYRTTWQKNIVQDEIFSIDSNAAINRPLKAVAIHASGSMPAGSVRTTAPSPVPTGCFSVDNLKGMILHEQVPPWMANLRYASPGVGTTTGIAGNKAVPMASSPATPPPPPPDGTLPDNQIQAKSVGLYDDYARLVYVSETLRGRSAVVSGKLRFDIAPGSSVKVTANSAQFTNNQGQLSPVFYGTVARVQIAIDAEAGRGQTVFQLINVRNEYENTLERTSIASNPLYGASFAGAPLVDAYLFQGDDT